MVHPFREDQGDEPAPCAEWSARDLVNHLVCEQMWAPHVLAGQALGEVGGRYDGDVLPHTWQNRVDGGRHAEQSLVSICPPTSTIQDSCRRLNAVCRPATTVRQRESDDRPRSTA
ncbi:maleylpyruvate isomerase N-terminal domain-containing protein [Amycolatopsis sp. NPDC005232]|uniref:maleylpyruvate isomerase N-terminal domain-containing protein n=1 Tax=Amycolatopsis sp. NPDC005232 TaxID=3157027 RepID=UPI0033A48BDB